MKELTEEHMKEWAKKVRGLISEVGKHSRRGPRDQSSVQLVAKGEYCPVCKGCCQSPPAISHVRFVPQKEC